MNNYQNSDFDPLRDLGYFSVYNRGEGDCFFLSVLQHLKVRDHELADITDLELRRLIVDYLKSKPDWLIEDNYIYELHRDTAIDDLKQELYRQKDNLGIFTYDDQMKRQILQSQINEQDRDKNWSRYLEVMSKQRVWAQTLILQATAHLFHTDIVITSKTQTKSNPWKPASWLNNGEPPITLLKTPGHYEAIFPLNKQALVNQKLNSIEDHKNSYASAVRSPSIPTVSTLDTENAQNMEQNLSSVNVKAIKLASANSEISLSSNSSISSNSSKDSSNTSKSNKNVPVGLHISNSKRKKNQKKRKKFENKNDPQKVFLTSNDQFNVEAPAMEESFGFDFNLTLNTTAENNLYESDHESSIDEANEPFDPLPFLGYYLQNSKKNKKTQNNFFLAILDQLKLINHKYSNESHMSLRERVSEYINSMPNWILDQMEHWVPLTAVQIEGHQLDELEHWKDQSLANIKRIELHNEDKDVVWTKYLAELRQLDTCIVSLPIKVMAKILGVDIWITSKHNHRSNPWEIYESGSDYVGQPITLLETQSHFYFESIIKVPENQRLCIGCKMPFTALMKHLNSKKGEQCRAKSDMLKLEQQRKERQLEKVKVNVSNCRSKETSDETESRLQKAKDYKSNITEEQRKKYNANERKKYSENHTVQVDSQKEHQNIKNVNKKLCAGCNILFTKLNQHLNSKKGQKCKEKIDLLNQQPLTEEQIAQRSENLAQNPLSEPGAALRYDCNYPYSSNPICSTNVGCMSVECVHCNALRYKDESAGFCCGEGQIEIPDLPPLPEPLNSLSENDHPQSNEFFKFIRKLNSLFAMTSFVADKKPQMPGYDLCFKVQGHVYHKIGSLLGSPNETKKFLQVYFCDTEDLELETRCQVFKNDKIPQSLVHMLQNMLHSHNALIHNFKSAHSMAINMPEFKLTMPADKPAGEHPGRFHKPTADDVLGFMIGDQKSVNRDVVIESHGNQQQIVSTIHKYYMSMQYPLLFPHGQEGFQKNIPKLSKVTGEPTNRNVTAQQYYNYLIQERPPPNEFYIGNFRKLFLQFLVDSYIVVEEGRLLYHKLNQDRYRSDVYSGLMDAVSKETSIEDIGKKTILPSSHVGSPRYMYQKTQDAMTYVHKWGTASLFLTMTCNPEWEEIQNQLKPGQKYYDRPDIVARVFRLKVKKLVDLICNKEYAIFGTINAFIYTIEWQKRGLPHCHMLIWLKKKLFTDDIDDVISAEIPDPEKDPKLHKNISKHNMHQCDERCQEESNVREKTTSTNENPTSSNENPENFEPVDPEEVDTSENTNSRNSFRRYNNFNGKKCTKGFPKDFMKQTETDRNGFPKYKRTPESEGGNFCFKNGKKVESDRCVPYNPLLSKLFNCHINVEFVASVRASIKYCIKYINKGEDAAVIGIRMPEEGDEIGHHYVTRSISSSHASWALHGWEIHEREPYVESLPVHLENEQLVFFKDRMKVLEEQKNPSDSKLMAFFKKCAEDEDAAQLYYKDFPAHYTWNSSSHEWMPRKIKKFKVGPPLGRINTRVPGTEEWHLRLLLNHVRGPTSFEDIRTVDGILCNSYQKACQMLDLLESDEQWDIALTEAAVSDSPSRMRYLFAIIITSCHPSDPKDLWEKHKEKLSEDFTRTLRKKYPDLDVQLNPDIENKCLQEIEYLVQDMTSTDKTLQDFGPELPKVKKTDTTQSRVLLRETQYDISELNCRVESNLPMLQPEQRYAYDYIMKAVSENKGNLIFIDAPGGTGKTFLLNLILASIRKNQDIALAVAFSGIAATLLDGGKTAHSTFKIPLEIKSMEVPFFNVKKNDSTGELFKRAKAILWDEVSMAPKELLEGLDNTLRDTRDSNDLMGGVTVIIAGDFRQTLPVIKNGTKADLLKACLKHSYLWDSVQKLQLKTNVRVSLSGDQDAKKFAAQLERIGEGNLIEVHNLHQIPCGRMIFSKKLQDLISRVFPNIKENIGNIDWLSKRAILTTKNVTAAEINDGITKELEGEARSYLSIDRVTEENEETNIQVEFLNSITSPGLPPHNLILKVGMPVMLMRNLAPPKLCNGTRLIVTRMESQLLELKIITGSHAGEMVDIPKIDLKAPSDLRIPFQRRQFPVRPSFAMTFNKSQGQTLDTVGLDLREECFTHGQFYVGCSRVKSYKELYILTPTPGYTQNVVFPEALRDKI